MQLPIATPLPKGVPTVNKVAVKIIWCMIFSQQWNRTDYSDRDLFSHHHFDYGNYVTSQQYYKQGECDVKGNSPYLGDNVLHGLDYQTSEVTHCIIYCYTVAENQNTLMMPTEKNQSFPGKLIKK